MAVGNIGIQFGIKSISQEKEIDTRIQVKEDFNFLRYSTSFGNNNIGVSFLNSDSINVDENIIIKDETLSVEENSPRLYSEQILTDQTFDLNYGSFLITDILKITSDNKEVPFYYWHNLSEYENISNVVILDGNFNPVNNDLFMYIDEESTLGEQRKGVYTNIKSSYNDTDSSYEIFYIRFKNEDTNVFITELLNAKIFYSLVTFDSTTKTRAYNVSSQVNGINTITVFFDSKSYSPTPADNSHRFFVKITGDNRIKVVKPIALDASSNWHLRIDPNIFYQSKNGYSVRYHVPEYANQIFSPVEPFKLAVEFKAKILNNKLIYSPLVPIANLGITGFFVYIILKDSAGVIQRALTNDPSAGVYITPSGITTDIFYEVNGIESIAEEDGFIRLNDNINTSYTAYVTYRYIEKYYVYNKLSVNSTINPDILDKKITMYVRGETDAAYGENIFHLVSDEDDNILDAYESSSYESILSITTGGGLNYISDSLLDPEVNNIGCELEILSGENAGRSLKITGTTISYSFANIGDVTFSTENYTLDFNGYTISFKDGATKGNEYIVLTNNNIDIFIEDGISTALDIVTAVNLSTVIPEITAATTSPSATQSANIGSTFSDASITLSVDYDFTTAMEAGARYRINKKINSYSVYDEVENITFDYDGWIETYTGSTNYYIHLADVFVIKTISPSSIDKYDIRIKGGGIAETFISEALKIQDEAQWYWDIGYWDGQPYPGMGAILVQLPREILKEVGGNFTREQVEDIVRRHIASGVYPIIKYYDRSTRIIDIEPGDQQIKITWEDVQASSYNIYYGINYDNLALYRSVAGIETSLTISELTNDKIYYIRVEAVVGGIQTLPSRIVSAIPFNFSIVKAPATYGITKYNEGTYSV